MKHSAQAKSGELEAALEEVTGAPAAWSHGAGLALELDVRSLADALDDDQRSVIQQEFQRAEGNWATRARAHGTRSSKLHHLAKRLEPTRELEATAVEEARESR